MNAKVIFFKQLHISTIHSITQALLLVIFRQRLAFPLPALYYKGILLMNFRKIYFDAKKKIIFAKNMGL